MYKIGAGGQNSAYRRKGIKSKPFHQKWSGFDLLVCDGTWQFHRQVTMLILPLTRGIKGV